MGDSGSGKRARSKNLLRVNQFDEIQPQDLVERRPHPEQSSNVAAGTNLNYFNGILHVEGVPPGAVYFGMFCLTIVAVQIVYAVLALLIRSFASVAVVYILARYGSEIFKVFTEGQVQISRHRNDLLTADSNNRTRISLREIDHEERNQRRQNQLETTRIQAGVRITEIQTNGQVQIEANRQPSVNYLEVHSYRRRNCHAHCNHCGRCHGHHRSDFGEGSGLVWYRR